MAPYSASKFALVGLSEGFRAEMRQHGISVTTVCPGLLRTGSPGHAEFKGQQKKEFAWFSIADALPGLTMSAEQAARQIWNACRRGDGEVILSLPAKFLAAFHGLLPGTTSEQNVTDYFRANNIKFQPVVIEAAAEIQSAFLSGRCDVYSNDRTDLVGIRSAQGPRAADLVILPETISKEPLGPLVRKNDARWFDLVRWTHFALVAAEELGVTQANVEAMRASPNPEIRRLLGVEGDFGKQLGVDNAWVVSIIKAVGNYGEVWDRNQKPLGVDRGLNRLWRDGGLQYAPPFR